MKGGRPWVRSRPGQPELEDHKRKLLCDISQNMILDQRREFFGYPQFFGIDLH